MKKRLILTGSPKSLLGKRIPTRGGDIYHIISVTTFETVYANGVDCFAELELVTHAKTRERYARKPREKLLLKRYIDNTCVIVPPQSLADYK